MKYLIVTETYPPEINGVALTVHNIVDCLVKLGHEVILIRPRQGKREGSSVGINGVTEYTVPGLPIPKYSELRFGIPLRGKIRRIIAEEKPIAAYLATEGPLGWSALKAAKRADLPVLTGFHTRFDQYMGHYGFKILEKTVGTYLKRFHNRSDGTLVPTQALKQNLEDTGYQNVKVLERAVDTQRFNPGHASQAVRKAWNIQGDGLAVLHVGRLAAEKNLQLAIRAFEAIQLQRPGSRFILVGDGPDREKLQAQYPHIHFCGMQTGQALSEHYASADMFLFPSLTETFGNVVLEALASGLPVIAYDYGAAHDFVSNGENGYLVPREDEDAFIKHSVILAGITRQLPDIHQNAQLSVDHLSPSHVAQRLTELFQLRPVGAMA